MNTYLELLTKLIAGDDEHVRRRQAITALSTLVGAVTIARAVDDEQLSQEILTSAANELKAYLISSAH